MKYKWFHLGSHFTKAHKVHFFLAVALFGALNNQEEWNRVPHKNTEEINHKAGLGGTQDSFADF